MYKDKEKQRQAQARHYQDNKQEYYTRAKLRRDARREWYRDFMQDKKCLCCPENDQACLDWHHVDPSTKVSNVTKMLLEHRPWDAVFSEMAKCVIVCANCHRKIHAGKLQISSP